MTTDKRMQKVVSVVSVLLGLLFLLTGGMKLAGLMVDQFVAWEYPAWFQYVIGGVEALAGVAFLNRSTRFPASATAVVIMAGAIFTLARAGAMGEVVTPVVTLVLALFVAKHSR